MAKGLNICKINKGREFKQLKGHSVKNRRRQFSVRLEKAQQVCLAVSSPGFQGIICIFISEKAGAKKIFKIFLIRAIAVIKKA